MIVLFAILVIVHLMKLIVVNLETIMQYLSKIYVVTITTRNNLIISNSIIVKFLCLHQKLQNTEKLTFTVLVY